MVPIAALSKKHTQMKKSVVPVIAVMSALFISLKTSENHMIASSYKLIDTIDSSRNYDTTSTPIPAPGNAPGVLDSTPFSREDPTPANPTPTPPPPDSDSDSRVSVSLKKIYPKARFFIN